MTDTILLPQSLEKSDKKHDHNTISKKFGTTPGSTISSLTPSEASPTSAPDQSTTKDIINASLCKSTCQKCLTYQTRWKEYCAEKNIIYDSSIVHPKSILHLNQEVSHSILISPKSAVAHVLE